MKNVIVTDISGHRGAVMKATEEMESVIADAFYSAVEEVGTAYFVRAVCHREEQQEQKAA